MKAIFAILVGLLFGSSLAQVNFRCFYYFQDDFLIYNVKSLNNDKSANQ